MVVIQYTVETTAGITTAGVAVGMPSKRLRVLDSNAQIAGALPALCRFGAVSAASSTAVLGQVALLSVKMTRQLPFDKPSILAISTS